VADRERSWPLVPKLVPGFEQLVEFNRIPAHALERVPERLPDVLPPRKENLVHRVVVSREAADESVQDSPGQGTTTEHPEDIEETAPASTSNPDSGKTCWTSTFPGAFPRRAKSLLSPLDPPGGSAAMQVGAGWRPVAGVRRTARTVGAGGFMVVGKKICGPA